MSETRELEPDSVNGRAATATDRPDADSRRRFRSSPRVGVGEAVSWHRITFAVPVILLTALAVAVGLRRAPDYTAEAKLALSANAGGTAGLAGFAANSQALTAGFAQAVDAPKVVRRVSRKAGLSQADVRSQVTASSTADSPVVRVQAISPTAAGAKSTANAASVALAGYVNQLNRSGGVQQRLLEEFQEATIQVDAAKAQLSEARLSGADPATVSEARQHWTLQS